MKDNLFSKLPFLQYLNGIKNRKSFGIIKYLKKKFNEQKKVKIDEHSNFIPLPNLKEYYNTLKRFSLKEPRNCEVVKYFLDAQIEVISEKYDYNKLGKNDVVLVCLIKNDISKIDEFINYYRKIGVKYFAFIDNCSTDGTFDFLLKEDSVNLYSCKDDYSTLKREGWLNRLYSRIGFNKWILCVDSDELYTFIGQEDRSINSFILAISSSYKRVRSIMIDMYSDKDLFIHKNDHSFQKEYCYFDADGYWEDNNYRSKMIYGGPRTRMFSMDNQLFKCALSKYPLFFYEKGDFQGSSHWSFPYKKNNDTILSILRHYKFTNSDMEKYKERVIKGNYANGSYEYKKYFEIIKNNKKITFYNEKSKLYNSSYDFEQLKIGEKKVEKVFK